MPDWSTVDCSEEADSIKENYTPEGGFNASVTLRCAWNDRHALVADFYTNLPAWPYGAVAAYPNGASIVSAGGMFTADGQVITDYGADGALVTVNWSSNAEAQLFSESLEPTAEFQLLDHTEFAWGNPDGDPLLEGEAPGRLLLGLNLVRTRYKLASIPLAVLTCVGHVNNAAYTSGLLGLTFPAETLLFQPGGMSRSITTSGSQGWDLTLKFRFKPEGWNKFWRTKDGAYKQIYHRRSRSLYRNFPLANFSGLFA